MITTSHNNIDQITHYIRYLKINNFIKKNKGGRSSSVTTFLAF